MSSNGERTLSLSDRYDRLLVEWIIAAACLSRVVVYTYHTWREDDRGVYGDNRGQYTSLSMKGIQTPGVTFADRSVFRT